MEIKIKMHSLLEDELKPDLRLIKNAIAQIKFENAEVDKNKLAIVIANAEEIDTLKDKIIFLNREIKAACGDERKALVEKRKEYKEEIANLLDSALLNLNEVGGGDYNHYNFDMHYNRVIAGLMGSTCYMQDTFDQLREKGIDDILAIAQIVEQNGHHSTYDHANLTLELSGIPKALAMILNNEKQYSTSEKSARYTIMDKVEPKQLELYNKWYEILKNEIAFKYGKMGGYFDKNRIGKLAQENARYMISVFTPTNLVYTTSIRQFNYLCHWFEDVINDPCANDFYNGVRSEMLDFVNFFKEHDLYSEYLQDGKNRKLSLFGPGILEEFVKSPIYAFQYDETLAAFAQSHRHKSTRYRIVERSLYDNRFYMLPILKNDNKRLKMWYEDISCVKDYLPQGKLVSVVETGELETFRMKAMERVCLRAQKEVRDLTQHYCGVIADTLGKEIQVIDEKLKFAHRNAELIDIKNGTLEYKAYFDRLSKGARCKNGFKCHESCGVRVGPELTSEV